VLLQEECACHQRVRLSGAGARDDLDVSAHGSNRRGLLRIEPVLGIEGPLFPSLYELGLQLLILVGGKEDGVRVSAPGRVST